MKKCQKFTEDILEKDGNGMTREIIRLNETNIKQLKLYGLTETAHYEYQLDKTAEGFRLLRRNKNWNDGYWTKVIMPYKYRAFFRGVKFI